MRRRTEGCAAVDGWRDRFRRDGSAWQDVACCLRKDGKPWPFEYVLVEMPGHIVTYVAQQTADDAHSWLSELVDV